MSNAKKTALITAVILIAVGLIIAGSAFSAAGFNPAALNTEPQTEKTYTVDEPFTSIRIEDIESAICLAPAEDTVCRVVCPESENLRHSVTVENGTLVVRREDSPRWHIGFGLFSFNWEPKTVTVYLPQAQYEDLNIQALSGRVEVPADFTFATADAYSASGAIDFAAQVRDDLRLTTVSGRIEARNTASRSVRIQSTSGRIGLTSVEAASGLSAETISGRIDMTDVQAGSADIGTTSGAIELTDVVTAEHLQAHSVSGQIHLTSCDGGSLQLHTTSGRISGTLRSDKVFTASSTSGQIDVPQGGSGGPCDASSISGSISLAVQ